MRRDLASLLALVAVGGLSGCISGGGAPPPLPQLAEDRTQPALALFEHVLTGYFARVGANAPTTCAELRPGPLSNAQEQALIARFVRLAPADRCTAGRDAITGDPAQMVQVYDFACRGGTLCTGWAQVPGQPAMRYAMRFENGAWRFDGDPRLLAE